jgi:hypothetical protein
MNMEYSTLLSLPALIMNMVYSTLLSSPALILVVTLSVITELLIRIDSSEIIRNPHNKEQRTQTRLLQDYGHLGCDTEYLVK